MKSGFVSPKSAVVFFLKLTIVSFSIFFFLESGGEASSSFSKPSTSEFLAVDTDCRSREFLEETPRNSAVLHHECTGKSDVYDDKNDKFLQFPDAHGSLITELMPVKSDRPKNEYLKTDYDEFGGTDRELSTNYEQIEVHLQSSSCIKIEFASEAGGQMGSKRKKETIFLFSHALGKKLCKIKSNRELFEAALMQQNFNKIKGLHGNNEKSVKKYDRNKERQEIENLICVLVFLNQWGRSKGPFAYGKRSDVESSENDTGDSVGIILFADLIRLFKCINQMVLSSIALPQTNNIDNCMHSIMVKAVYDILKDEGESPEERGLCLLDFEYILIHFVNFVFELKDYSTVNKQRFFSEPDPNSTKSDDFPLKDLTRKSNTEGIKTFMYSMPANSIPSCVRCNCRKEFALYFARINDIMNKKLPQDPWKQKWIEFKCEYWLGKLRSILCCKTCGQTIWLLSSPRNKSRSFQNKGYSAQVPGPPPGRLPTSYMPLPSYPPVHHFYSPVENHFHSSKIEDRSLHTPSLKESREGAPERRHKAVLSVLPKPSTEPPNLRSFNDCGYNVPLPNPSNPVLMLSPSPLVPVNANSSPLCSYPPSLKELREGGSEHKRRAVLNVLPKPSTGSTLTQTFNDGGYLTFPNALVNPSPLSVNNQALPMNNSLPVPFLHFGNPPANMSPSRVVYNISNFPQQPPLLPAPTPGSIIMMIPFNPFRPLCEINSERNQNKLVGPPAMPTVSPNPLSPEKGYKTLTVPSVNSCDVPSPGVNALSFDKTAQRSGASPPSLKESREGDAERRRRAVLSVLPKLSTGETQSRSFNDGVYTQYPKDSEFVDPVLGLSGTPGTARRLCSEPPARNSFGDGIDFNERESSITGATATKTDYDKVGKMSTVNPKEKINEERTLTTQETSYPKPTSAPNYQRAEQNHLNETRQKDDIAEQNRIYDVRNALPRSVSFSGFSKISIEGSISVERGLTAAPPFAFYSEKDQPPSSRLCSSSPSFCRSYSPSLSTSSVLSSISELDGNSEDDEEYTQSPKECRAGGSEHRRRAVLGVPLKPSPEPTNSEYFGEWG